MTTGNSEAMQMNVIHHGVKVNAPQVMDGIALLQGLPDGFTPLVFFDPQYRGVLDKLQYGHPDSAGRQPGRKMLPQMTTSIVQSFVGQIERVLTDSGHLLMWLDKFSVMEQLFEFTEPAQQLKRVDMITWHKQRIGMGYRTRRACEYLVVLQKYPVRASGIWLDRGIPDVWSESVSTKHPHSKPLKLQQRLIEALTKHGDIVVDPAAGSYSVLRAAASCGRRFVGCDLKEFAQTLPLPMFDDTRTGGDK